ncbi:MAG: hypothetical protein ACI9AF_001016, partial [Granulosicoccus sp.]
MESREAQPLYATKNLLATRSGNLRSSAMEIVLNSP